VRPPVVLVAILVLLGLVSAGLQSVPPGVPTAAAVLPQPEPNFVVIFLDDMRADQLSGLPYTTATIGGQGAIFDNAYAPYPLCCPARATILSGQYPHNNNVFGNVPPLGGVSAFDDTHTIATWMNGAGYETAYMGKYFNGYGVATPSTYSPPGWTEWDVLARGLYNYRRFTLNINEQLVDYVGSYQTHVMGTLSTRFIRKNAGSPFLMVTGFKAPHSGGPREPDDPDATVSCFATDLCGNKTPAVSAPYRDSETGHPMPVSSSYDEADVSDKPAHIASLPSFQPEFSAAHQELWEQQLESIRAVDDQIHRIVWTLRKEGVLKRTYILVTSDNGYLLGEHRIPFGKVHPYEPSARIPMMLRGPGIPAGVHPTQLVGLQDIAPTVLRATGNYGIQTHVLDGVSLLRLTTDRTASARRDLALEAGPPGDVADEGAVADASPAARAYRGIRTDGGWKYVRYRNGEQELYNLRTDPAEMNNLAQDPLHQQRLLALAEASARLSNCVGRACMVSAAE
jgi:N-acetylglucosamine-6-sulfatase